MYLHLGQSAVVPEASIIGIFDLDNTTGSRITREFLSDAEKTGRVISVSDELPNSFVVCDEGFEEIGFPRRMAPTPFCRGGKEVGGRAATMRIYLSQLSSQTLLRRSETTRFEM